jgi:hypothetical protein
MKTCPHCGDTEVIIFDSNNDLCQGCKKWFPAVEDVPEIYCHACSAAGGADQAVYHTAPACPCETEPVVEDGAAITCGCGICRLDPESCGFTNSCAGHPPPA